MNTPRRYQYGSLTRRKRIRTEDVWQFRYYETTPEGQRRRRFKDHRNAKPVSDTDGYTSDSRTISTAAQSSKLIGPAGDAR
jgi:hypothetical protein